MARGVVLKPQSPRPDAVGSGRMSAGWVIAGLVLFALPAAAIDFFHTEHELSPCDSCPACQLRQATGSEVATVAAAVPVLALLGTVEPAPITPPTECVATEPAARGPPWSRAAASNPATPA